MQYIDLKISRKDGCTVPVVAADVVKRLHQIFASDDNKGRYAIALPAWAPDISRQTANPLSIIRVFCREAEEMVSLQAAFEEEGLYDFTRIKAPKQVPKEFTGPYRAYTRFRIKSRKADRQKERLGKLQQAEREQLPYFKLRSTTNRHSFSLMVSPKDKGCPGVWSPDSYGLGGFFALPVLPV